MNTSQPFLNHQRLFGDHDADNLIRNAFQDNNQTRLYELLQMNSWAIIQSEDSELKSFLLKFRMLPDWYNQDIINRGQLFFKKYALPIMTFLGGMSLPYCYAASPGNKALYFSDKMRQSPGKRLLDTADFIIAVSTAENLGNNHDAQIQINKLRLVHAIARYYIQKSGKWNMDWGLPINQEDMAGTNLAFSYIILKGLQKAGYMIIEREKESFLSLWRYIGYQLNIETELLPGSMKEAAELERTIRKRHFKNSEEGVILTKELIKYYKSMTTGQEQYLLDSQIRYWLGSFVADCVGITAQRMKDTLVQTINLFQESTNFYRVDPFSFSKMMHNHKQLKNQFSNKA